MKIVFSDALVIANAQTAANILAAFDADTPARTEHIVGFNGRLRAFHGSAHALSFDAERNEYTYVVDDALLVRILNLYIKVAFIVAPVVQSVMSVLKRLKGEVLPQADEINEEFMHIQYIDEMVEAGGGDEGLDIRTAPQGDPVLAN